MLRRVLATALARRRQVRSIVGTAAASSISAPPLRTPSLWGGSLLRSPDYPHPVFKKYAIHPDACYSSCIKVFVLRLSRRMKLLLLTYSRRHSVPLADVFNRLRAADPIVAEKTGAATSDAEAMKLFVYRFAEPDSDWMETYGDEEMDAARYHELMAQERLERLANPHKRQVHFLHAQRNGAAARVMATPPGELTSAWLDATLEYAESSVLLEHLLRGIATGCKVDPDVVAPLTPSKLRNTVWNYYESGVPQMLHREMFETFFPETLHRPERYLDKEVESPVFIDNDGRKQQATHSPGSCVSLELPMPVGYEKRLLDGDTRLLEVLKVLEVLGNYHPNEDFHPKEGSLPSVFQLAHGFLTDVIDALHLRWKPTKTACLEPEV